MTQQLGLSRSTLLSLLVMVSTVGIFATGATFAVTTTDSTSGIVKAGAIGMIDVYGTGAAQDLLFIPGADTCPDGVLPGEACAATVTVKNTGSLPIAVGTPVATVTVVDGVAPSGCSASDWDTSLGLSTPPPAALATGGTWTFNVIVTLDPADPVACQLEAATVTVSVDGTF